MSTHVNGHLLPAELDRLVAAGQWGPGHGGDFSRLPIDDQDDLALLDVAGMIRNTESLREILERGEGNMFALTAGSEAVPGRLAVDQAVMIAATRGQEALVLDYAGRDQPRVLATARAGWVEVAATFDELLAVIHLPKH
jgi:hypothetical protein